jgi:hypothetical protein
MSTIEQEVRAALQRVPQSRHHILFRNACGGKEEGMRQLERFRDGRTIKEKWLKAILELLPRDECIDEDTGPLQPHNGFDLLHEEERTAEGMRLQKLENTLQDGRRGAQPPPIGSSDELVFVQRGKTYRPVVWYLTDGTFRFATCRRGRMRHHLWAHLGRHVPYTEMEGVHSKRRYTVIVANGENYQLLDYLWYIKWPS